MSKKFIISCLALVAFAAFALPAAASANNEPQLTDGGKLLATGVTVVGKNSGETTFTDTFGNGLVHCSNVTMSGPLLTNSNNTVEGTITTKTFAGSGTVSSHNGLNECTGSFGNAYITVEDNLCIRSTPTMATDEFQVGSDSGSCTSPGNVRFIIGSTTAGPCTYETASTVKGDYTTNGTQALLTVRNTVAGSGAKLTSGSFLCPSSGMLKMSFGLQTEGGTPLTIS